MKPSTELFQLIKSLTKSEKRYFKLSSSLQSGEKNYMKLFDAIENQQDYDEHAIKEEFKNEVFIKHLPSEKNHLYNLILKSLRGFYSDNSAASILQEQLRNIELLYNKALYKECLKYIKKAKTIAYSFEKFYFLLDLIDWEKKLIQEGYSRGVFKTNLSELLTEEEECLEKLKNIAEYQKLYSQVNFAIRNRGFARDEDELKIIEDVANHHLIVGKKTALSTKAATACYSIKGMCATNIRDYVTSFQHFSKVVKIFEDNPSILKELPKRYIRALNSIVYAHIHHSRFNQALETIEKIKGLKNKSGFESMDIQLNIFTLAYNAQIIVSLKMGEYTKAINSIIPKILVGIEAYSGKLSKEDEIILYYNISRVYFGAYEYKTSLKYINEVLNNQDNQLRQDVFTFARLVSLSIHFELENYDLLEYTIKSAKRYINKNQRNYQFETMFLKRMRKLIKAKNDDDLHNQLEVFRNEMVEVLDNPFEKVVIQYFDFITWIETKLLKKTYSELIKDKYSIA